MVYTRAMITLLPLVLLACGDANTYDIAVLPPAISLSPTLSTVPAMAPGDHGEVTVSLDSIGGQDAEITVELIDFYGTGMSIDMAALPDVLPVDDRVDVVVSFDPTQSGPVVAFVHATVLRADDCEEAWAAIRGHAQGDDCDPDDFDCDGQTLAANDCDDDDPYNHIVFPEICDGKDNNCDGTADEMCTDGQCGHPAP
jgi:hypothetical protein